MGDFVEKFSRTEAGIATVEGQVSGARAAMLSKERDKAQADFEKKKQSIIDAGSKSLAHIDDKFSGSVTNAESVIAKETVGLVTAEEFRKIRERATRKESVGSVGDGEEEKVESKATIKKKKKKKKMMMATLSFAGGEEDEDEDASPPLPKKKKSKKNPEVETSFLPDKDREMQQKKEERKLKQEWEHQQEKIKNEKLSITYSYWDGSGHRREIKCKKGNTVGEFLELVRLALSDQFREVAAGTAEDLMYVKEDIILPSDITFYDLIATKARGKSGPLFNFDVHDDIRVGVVDSRLEKDESHPGKIVERRWYERNKHIFPASRWETYDPLKTWDRYTIHGGEVNSDK